MKICSFVKISQSIMIANLCLGGRWKFDLQSALLSANHCLTRDTKYFTWGSLVVNINLMMTMVVMMVGEISVWVLVLAVPSSSLIVPKKKGC